MFNEKIDELPEHGKDAFVEDEVGEEGIERGEGAPGSSEVKKFLSGISYPTTKQKLIKHAKARKVEKRILDSLDDLPEKNYDSPVAVSRELGQLS